jgi:two-component system sensor histidine kinase RpfC
MIPKARRLFPFNIHMGTNGFIGTALFVQLFSLAGVMPTQVWLAEPGYAVTVCLGLFALSACILFSLRSLLTEASQEQTHKQSGNDDRETRSAPRVQDLGAPAPRAPCALVVQDIRTTQVIIEKSLEKGGVRCVSVNDGLGARQAFDGQSFDVVIADATWMANSRSSDFRAMLRGKGIPTLALAEANSQGPYCVADAIITMPIVPRDLVRKTAELMGRSPATEKASSYERTTPQRELPKLEPDPLDARALGDLEKLGGRDFVRDIVAQFVADAAGVLASLTAAIAMRDSKTFREQAHALRSCAANVGAQNVYRMCLAWRDLDAQEIAASGSQYMRMLEEEFERVRGALAPMLQQDNNGTGPDNKAA